MKILKYDNHEKDILQITRGELISQCRDFIEDNGFISSLKEDGKREAIILEQLKNIVLMYEFADKLFGKEDE